MTNNGGEKLTPKKADEWRPVFLHTLRNSGNVRASCQAAGITRQVAYAHRNNAPAFAKDWDEALQDAIDALEAVAIQRARASSDTLLIFLLKAHRPALYRETINQNIKGVIGIKGYGSVSPDDWDRSTTEE